LTEARFPIIVEIYSDSTGERGGLHEKVSKNSEVVRYLPSRVHCRHHDLCIYRAYTGSYDGYRWKNTVTVTVENHVITNIVRVKGPAGREEIALSLTEAVLGAQSPDVDAVTGATADSKAFLKAVENALQG
jgi:uncharacterized protein with FMN-binding domain